MRADEHKVKSKITPGRLDSWFVWSLHPPKLYVLIALVETTTSRGRQLIIHRSFFPCFSAVDKHQKWPLVPPSLSTPATERPLDPWLCPRSSPPPSGWTLFSRFTVSGNFIGLGMGRVGQAGSRSNEGMERSRRGIIGRDCLAAASRTLPIGLHSNTTLTNLHHYRVYEQEPSSGLRRC